MSGTGVAKDSDKVAAQISRELPNFYVGIKRIHWAVMLLETII